MPKDQYEIFLKSLERKRAPALATARALIAQGKFDEAELTVKRVDDSIYGAVALAKAYREHLTELVSTGTAKKDRPHAEAVFHRAKLAAWGAYPEPHTEIEADNIRSGCAEDLSGLVKILGYEPTAPR